MSGGSDIEAIRKEVKTYIGVFVALMVLTLATVAASYADVAVPIAIGVALVIAAVKGSLVVNFFMHLGHEKKIIFAALLLTVAFFVVLMFVPLFTASDTIALEH
jgi:cytochrome c oxidase subunit 4